MNSLAENPNNREYSFEEYLSFIDNCEDKFELIDGKIIPVNRSNGIHQDVMLYLAHILFNYLDDKPCVVRTEYIVKLNRVHLDGTLNEKDFNAFIPDLIVNCDESKEEECDAYINGAPTILVEIWSKSNGLEERLNKISNYVSNRVREVWQIYLLDKKVLIYSRVEGKGYVEREFKFTSEISSLIFPDLKFTLSRFKDGNKNLYDVEFKQNIK